MAKYALTQSQKVMLSQLARAFERGCSSAFVIQYTDDGIGAILGYSEPPDVELPIPQLDDLTDFENAGLMKVVRRGTHGAPNEVHFHKQLVLDAVRSDFEIHPTQRHGDDNRKIVIGTNYGNVGIDNRFDQIVQTFNFNNSLSSSQREELQTLFRQLGEQTQALPDEHEEDKETISLSAEDVATELQKEKPNPKRLKITMDGLIKAAENLGRLNNIILPLVLKISAVVAPLLAIKP